VESPKDYLQTLTRALFKSLAVLLVGFLLALKAVPGQVHEGFREAWLGLRSPDRPTRRMSLVFYVSLVGVAISCYQFGQYYVAKKQREKIARVAEETRLAEERVKEVERRRLREPPPYQTLGTFSLELREAEGVVRSAGGLNAAEMEIVVSCSDIEACDWIKGHVDLARGELGSLFTATDRDRILSTPGKKAFREEIRDALNKLLEEKGIKGTVLEVLFPRFIVS
jgi:flagellar basal body-associated protein FliL